MSICRGGTLYHISDTKLVHTSPPLLIVNMYSHTITHYFFRRSHQSINQSGTEAFFTGQSARLLEEAQGHPDGMLWYAGEVTRQVEDEIKRGGRMFKSTTAVQLRKICEEKLIKSHLTALLGKQDNGCQSLMEAERYDDVRLLIKLASRPNVGGTEKAAESVEKHIAKVR